MRVVSSALIGLLFISVVGQAKQDVWVYPCELIETYKPDCECWHGINEVGGFGNDIYVIPERFLIGPPPSEFSAVTITTDHWIEVRLPGPMVDGSGPDLLVREMGRKGETALVLLSNGQGQTYPIGNAVALNTGGQLPTESEFDLQGIDPGFSPTAVRIVSLGLGGGSPGFDVASVQARISVDTTRPHLPVPCNHAQHVSPDAPLQWQNTLPKDHIELYAGPDPNLLEDPNQPIAVLPGDANSFAPSTYWSLGETYYWRVATVNDSDPNASALSDLWQFTVDDQLVVDNFESYVSTSALEEKWIYDNPSPFILMDLVTRCPDETYGNCRAVRIDAQDFCCNCALAWTHTAPQDWSIPDATHLELSLQVPPDNLDIQKLFLRIGDGQTQVDIPYEGELNDLRDGLWHAWCIGLDRLIGLDRQHIITFELYYCYGILYIDDIHLRGDHNPLNISEPNDRPPWPAPPLQDDHL